MNRPTKLLLGALAAVVIILGASYYFNSHYANNGEIKIGLILPLSGQYASAGDNVKNGVILAKEQYEAGNPGKDVTLVIEDDGFNAQKGLAAYKKLTAIDGINGLVNISTPVIEAIYGDINDKAIPTTQLGLQSKGAGDDYIFQMSPNDVSMVEKLAKYLAENRTFKKLVIVHENTSFHNKWIEPFKKNYTRDMAGVFILESKDSMRQTLAKAMSMKPDAIVIFMNSEVGAIFTKELITVYKEKPTLIYDAQLQSGWEDYGRILGDRNVLNGSLTVWLKGGNSESFIKDYTNRFKSPPGFWADIGYDAFSVLINNYDLNAKVWKNNLQKTNVSGASGHISFDDIGIRIQPIIVNEVKNGQLVLSYSEPD